MCPVPRRRDGSRTGPELAGPLSRSGFELDGRPDITKTTMPVSDCLRVRKWWVESWIPEGLPGFPYRAGGIREGLRRAQATDR